MAFGYLGKLHLKGHNSGSWGFYEIMLRFRLHLHGRLWSQANASVFVNLPRIKMKQSLVKVIG
jgi:hypothetical protein